MRQFILWFWQQVFPNLFASLICFTVAALWARAHLLRLHRAVRALHHRLDGSEFHRKE